MSSKLFTPFNKTFTHQVPTSMRVFIAVSHNRLYLNSASITSSSLALIPIMIRRKLCLLVQDHFDHNALQTMLLITELGWPTMKHCKDCTLDKSASKNDRLGLTSFTTKPARKLKKKKHTSDRFNCLFIWQNEADHNFQHLEWTEQLLYLVNLSGESAGVDASLTRPHPLLRVSSWIQTMKLLALTEQRQAIRINR